MSYDHRASISSVYQSHTHFARDVTAQDCVLILLGGPGAGRTTFIHTLTGQPMELRPREERLDLDTTAIDYRCVTPTSWTKGNRLLVIDTPAIDGNENYYLFRNLMAWIQTAVEKRVAFLGFIYVHDLMTTPHVVFDFLHLRGLLTPCIKGGIRHRLVLVGTKRMRLPEQEAAGYLHRMKNTAWWELIQGGAIVVELPHIGVSERGIVMNILPEAPAGYSVGRYQLGIF